MKYTTISLAAAAFAATVGSANAAVVYADSVSSFTQGTCYYRAITTDPGANNCSLARSDANNALGAADGNMVALGLGGDITVGFSGAPYEAATSTVYEVTTNRNAYHDEAVDVYSVLGGVETFIGTLFNNVASSSLFITSAFDSLRLVDVTLREFATSNSYDGFDVDSIAVAPVPLPAAGLMLLAGVGGLGVMRRRQKA